MRAREVRVQAQQKQPEQHLAPPHPGHLSQQTQEPTGGGETLVQFSAEKRVLMWHINFMQR